MLLDSVLYDSLGFEGNEVEDVVEQAPSLYLAGHMLDAGAVMRREWEAEQLRKAGAKLHVPHEDKSINDKANAVQEGLAERIVANDTQGILDSDVIVIDAHENGKGTLVELGQIKGMRDMAEMVKGALEAEEVPFECGTTYFRVMDVVNSVLEKKVFAHNTDIRRANSQPQAGDRREYAPNQYVYGTVLKLTDGKGFYEWDEIIEEVKEMCE